MANTLEEALVHIFGHEGGFTRDSRDPGNWTGGKIGVGENRGTKYGIACHAHPNVDIANLTLAQAAQIYRTQYAAPVGYADLPAGVDLVAFDASVNSGPSASLRFLGRALGVIASAAAVVSASNVAKDKIAVIKAACAERLAFMRSLAIWATYGVGWSRRVASIEATAVKWSLRDQKVPAAQVKQQLVDQSAIANTQVSGNIKKAATGAGGTIGTGGASWWGSLDLTQQLGIIAIGLLLAFGVFFFINRAIVNRQRANAYAEVAATA
jgi:lysozyme family protein